MKLESQVSSEMSDSKILPGSTGQKQDGYFRKFLLKQKLQNLAIDIREI